jgi:hypothetical protein
MEEQNVANGQLADSRPMGGCILSRFVAEPTQQNDGSGVGANHNIVSPVILLHRVPIAASGESSPPPHRFPGPSRTVRLRPASELDIFCPDTTHSDCGLMARSSVSWLMGGAWVPESLSLQPGGASVANTPEAVGNSTLQVGRIGLGCMGMSEFYGPSDDAASLATLHHALDVWANRQVARPGSPG